MLSAFFLKQLQLEDSNKIYELLDRECNQSFVPSPICTSPSLIIEKFVYLIGRSSCKLKFLRPIFYKRMDNIIYWFLES